MKLVFLERGWEDYLEWQREPKLLRKVNELIRDCMRSSYDGLGKPEPLKHELAGWWSRRISKEHRLVYRIDGDQLFILQCRYHYG